MNYPRIPENLRREINNHGLTNALYKKTLATINFVLLVKTWKCITIDTPDPRFLETESRYTCSFLDRDQLFAFAKNSEYEITVRFLESALAKGDECYGIVDGEVLASYGWYSNAPTDLTKELRLSFHPHYMYMYKGYTNDRYRGQRLHAVGMTRALQVYRERGYKGLVSVVEGENFNSLKSCYRMGYKDFGTVYAAKGLGRYFLWHSAGCQEYDFRVDPIPSPAGVVLPSSSSQSHNATAKDESTEHERTIHGPH